MKKINHFVRIGLVFNAIFLILNHYDFIPEFLKGFCAGMGICFILFGLYAANHDITRFKNFKKVLIQHILPKK